MGTEGLLQIPLVGNLHESTKKVSLYCTGNLGTSLGYLSLELFSLQIIIFPFMVCSVFSSIATLGSLPTSCREISRVSRFLAYQGKGHTRNARPRGFDE